MALKKMDISNEVKRGWALFKPNMALLIVAGLLASVVGALTCGLLSAPLLAGVFMIIARLQAQDTTAPTAGDVFKGFELFLPSLLLMVIVFVLGAVVGWIPIVGQLVSLVVGSVLFWGLMFVAYQKLSAVEALKKVWQLTKSGEFTMPLVLGIVANLVSALGVLACVIGVLFTFPLSLCIMATAYQTLFGEDTAEQVAQ